MAAGPGYASGTVTTRIRGRRLPCASLRPGPRWRVTGSRSARPSTSGTIAYRPWRGGVFHAWYVTRLIRNEAEVIGETEGRVSRERYLTPLTARLVAAYGP